VQAIIWGKSSPEYLKAAAKGLEASGYRVKFLRPHVRDVESSIEPADLVVVAGTRLQSAEVRDLYQANGTRVLVIDAPPIRLQGFYAVTPWRVNNIPATAVAERLGLIGHVEPVRNPGWKVLVCGQTAEDAAHLLTKDELRRFYGDTLRLLSRKWGSDLVEWRSHPRNPMAFEGVGVSEHETIDEALDDGVAALVSFNSTCGITSLLRGVPTYCHPYSFYSEVAEVGLPSPFHLRVPNRDRLWSFLARVMACQWSLEELATSDPWRAAIGRLEVARDADVQQRTAVL